jgi:hypothetical protein
MELIKNNNTNIKYETMLFMSTQDKYQLSLSTSQEVSALPILPTYEKQDVPLSQKVELVECQMYDLSKIEFHFEAYTSSMDSMR